jgi:hypothetical protein
MEFDRSWKIFLQGNFQKRISVAKKEQKQNPISSNSTLIRVVFSGSVRAALENQRINQHQR